MHRRTYRNVDGERVEGTWRHAFTRNGDTYYLTDLVVYADGAIDCGGGLTDLNGLREKLACGCVATTLPEGAQASAHHVANWKFSEPQTWIDADMLAGEVADEIDRLNNRPDSTGRCMLAVNAYLADMTEENRLTVRARYLEIPEHMRQYALGDMDHLDRPLRILITDLGQSTYTRWPGDPTFTVTQESRAGAIEYFRERDASIAKWEARVPADGPERPEAATLTLSRTYFPNGWLADPGIKVLQNDYPATITINGRDYPSVIHAYWALSTRDPDAHDKIATAPRAYEAGKLAEHAPRRANWPAARLAVMAGLLRAKYAQHPDLAQVLLATADARIIYTDVDSAYWVASGQQGTNWVGRLLEVIRSELAATGITLH